MRKLKLTVKKMMDLIYDIYEQADKGEASNVVLNNETVYEMQKKIKRNGMSG